MKKDTRGIIVGKTESEGEGRRNRVERVHLKGEITKERTNYR